MEIDTRIYINLIYYPILTLGPDKRVGVWFEGCDLECKGCISKHTWQQNDGNLIEIVKLVDKVLSFNCKQITISGGEPFFQAEKLYEFLIKIRKYFDDILVYSGYKYEYLQKNHNKILELIDVLIDGEFQIDNPTNKAYKGSKNQRMFVLNEKVVDKYKPFFVSTNKNIQIIEKNNKIYFIGIPKGDRSEL